MILPGVCVLLSHVCLCFSKMCLCFSQVCLCLSKMCLCFRQVCLCYLECVQRWALMWDLDFVTHTNRNNLKVYLMRCIMGKKC